jgi:MFS family permease
VINLGGAVGPVIGGAVAGGLSWQWIFWVNVPVGAALILLAAPRLRERYGPSARLDVTGLLLTGAGFRGSPGHWCTPARRAGKWQVTGPLAGEPP